MIQNSSDSFGWFSIVMHWLSFLLVTFLLAGGLYMVGLTYYDPLYHTLPEWHKLFGVILAVLTLMRVAWILYSKPPSVLAENPFLVRLAKLMHWVLYAGLVVLIVTGYLMTTADGKSIQFFETEIMPASVQISQSLSEWFGKVHRWSAYGLAGLVLLHALAAFKHHFMNRDTTLKRMLFPLK